MEYLALRAVVLLYTFQAVRPEFSSSSCSSSSYEVSQDYAPINDDDKCMNAPIISYQAVGRELDVGKSKRTIYGPFHAGLRVTSSKPECGELLLDKTANLESPFGMSQAQPWLEVKDKYLQRNFTWTFAPVEPQVVTTNVTPHEILIDMGKVYDCRSDNCQDAVVKALHLLNGDLNLIYQVDPYRGNFVYDCLSAWVLPIVNIGIPPSDGGVSNISNISNISNVSNRMPWASGTLMIICLHLLV